QVIAGDSVPYLAIHDGLGPINGSLWFKLSTTGDAIDGKPIPGSTGGYGAMSGFGSGSMGSSVSAPPPGKHQLSLTFRVEVFKGPFSSLALTPVYHADHILTGNFEVLAT